MTTLESVDHHAWIRGAIERERAESLKKALAEIEATIAPSFARTVNHWTTTSGPFYVKNGRMFFLTAVNLKTPLIQVGSAGEDEEFILYEELTLLEFLSGNEEEAAKSELLCRFADLAWIAQNVLNIDEDEREDCGAD